MRDPPLLTDVHHAHGVAGHAVIGWLQGFAILGLSLDEEDEWAATIDYEGPTFPGAAPITSEGDTRAALALIRALLAPPAALFRYGFGSAGETLDLEWEEIVTQPVVLEALSLAGRIKRRGRAVWPRVWLEVAAAFEDPDTSARGRCPCRGAARESRADRRGSQCHSRAEIVARRTARMGRVRRRKRWRWQGQ
ncbi:MAG TPA: hypothetical protein VHT03_00820 [Rhizomicrobium sp.]|jgi:hypothetical protein|nr:hypothetical protein [Rhizomicrobium sp.]